MKILIVTPAPRASRRGNRISAERYARLLRKLGHRVTVTGEYDGRDAELLVALHAKKSGVALARFRRRHPHRPAVLVLTGTDVYGDIQRSRLAQRSLELAHRIVTLQPLAIDVLPPGVRHKARAIVQSAEAPRNVARARRGFVVTVVGHLRPVKDPFRAARAASRLPAESRVRIEHIGDALLPELARRARELARREPRYTWRGPLPRSQALRRIARSHVLCLTSVNEGGANVVCEAIACGVPVVTTDIPGSLGVLGEGYPATFPVGDTAALAELLYRCETDERFYRRLETWVARRQALVRPARELDAWRKLLVELTSPP